MKTITLTILILILSCGLSLAETVTYNVGKDCSIIVKPLQVTIENLKKKHELRDSIDKMNRTLTLAQANQPQVSRQSNSILINRLNREVSRLEEVNRVLKSENDEFKKSGRRVIVKWQPFVSIEER